jgi:hypothetical protein
MAIAGLLVVVVLVVGRLVVVLDVVGLVVVVVDVVLGEIGDFVSDSTSALK